MWAELYARFRALSMYYKEAHWTVAGSFFYGDHLLLDRLHGEVEGEIDAIVEKGIGVSQSMDFALIPNHLSMVAEIVRGYPHTVADNVAFFAALTRMEGDLCQFLGVANAQLENNGDCLLKGVQNMLQGFLDSATQRLYLLHQRTALH